MTSQRQFSIRRVMVLTLAAATVFAIAVHIAVPRLFQGLLAAYFLFFGGWAILRGPAVLAGLADYRVRRREIKDHRGELEREARDLLKRQHGSKPQS